MHIKGKTFPILLGLTALFVETVAAFFSVYGLSKLFSGATTAVIVMAASLEVSKVVTASFLYRHWDTTHFIQKSYMVLAVLVLISITSMGIYGFLSNAFQASTVGIEKQTTQVSLYEQEVSRLTKDKEATQLEKRELQQNLNAELKGFAMSDTSRRYVDAGYRSRSMKRYQPAIDDKERQIQSINKRLEELSTKISDTKVRMIETGADVGPIIFVAKLFKAEISTVVQYLIFVFILVFDPLAVVLVIATNKAWIEMKMESTVHFSVPTNDIPIHENLSADDRRKLKDKFEQFFAPPKKVSPPEPITTVPNEPVAVVTDPVEPIPPEPITPIMPIKNDAPHGMPPAKDATSIGS